MKRPASFETLLHHSHQALLQSHGTGTNHLPFTSINVQYNALNTFHNETFIYYLHTHTELSSIDVEGFIRDFCIYDIRYRRYDLSLYWCFFLPKIIYESLLWVDKTPPAPAEELIQMERTDRKVEEQNERKCMCIIVCVWGGDTVVGETPLEGGFVLKEFIKKRAIPVPDARRIGANVLEHVYGPAQAPIHKVRVPGWVSFSGHVYFNERTLRLDGPASCIHGLCGPYLENWKAGVGGCFVWLLMLPSQASCGGGLGAAGAWSWSHWLCLRG